MRLRRLRRELEPTGPPPRSLTWQAMEQIRSLRQAFPEEWPVARLAQGFSVSPDVIQRVLRSTFCPSPERRAKQDAKVLGPEGSPDPTAQLVAKSAGEGAQQLLPAGPKDASLCRAPPAPGGQSSRSQPQRKGQSSRSSRLVPLQADGARREAAGRSGSLAAGATARWDGEVRSEEELEELAAEGWDAGTEVVRRGQEYFDSHGHFLYRVPSRLAHGEGGGHRQPLAQADAKAGKERQAVGL